MSCVVTRQPHRLQVVLSTGSGEGPDIVRVVRWCRDCGAVVVDIDVDGQTSPGADTPMRFPALAYKQTSPAGSR